MNVKYLAISFINEHNPYAKRLFISTFSLRQEQKKMTGNKKNIMQLS